MGEASSYERRGGSGRAEDESCEHGSTVKQQGTDKAAFHWGGGGGGSLLPPANTHSTQPLLPSLVRSSYQSRNAGQTQEAEERTRWSEESQSQRFLFLPAACPLPPSWHSELQLQRPPETPRPNPKERLITGTTAPQCAQSCLAAHILIPLSEEETQFPTRS